jgi:endonuclease YncB( thermonuclease family)
MLYIDAPETAQRLGSLSTAILRDALPIGGTVGLRFDVDSLDSFGRTLAWIETPRFENLNLYMANDGWVTDLIIAPNTALSAVVRSGVASARAAPRGLWTRGFASCLPSAFRRGDCND